MPLNAFGAAKQMCAKFRDLASATSLVLPNDYDNFRLTGSTKVDYILASINPGRVIRFTGPSSSSVALDNVDAAGATQMNLGGSDITLSADDHIALKQRSDGHWERITEAANT